MADQPKQTQQTCLVALKTRLTSRGKAAPEMYNSHSALGITVTASVAAVPVGSVPVGI